MIDFSQNYFALFGLPVQFALDGKALDTAYRAEVARTHPDRFASATDAERRLSLQASTRINEAYQTLKSPLARARYLLAQAGVDTQEETNTAMPMDFLMAQMAWRESIADAKASQDVATLEKLAAEMRSEIVALENTLHEEIDMARTLDAAAMSVRKLRFMEKLDQEIGNAIEAVLF